VSERSLERVTVKPICLRAIYLTPPHTTSCAYQGCHGWLVQPCLSPNGRARLASKPWHPNHNPLGPVASSR
jgi:hypothetical protein